MNLSDTLSIDIKEVGCLWAKKFKSNRKALPSMYEVIDGLYKHYYEMVHKMSTHITKEKLKLHLSDKIKVFD